jgi:hypothetical protein
MSTTSPTLPQNAAGETNPPSLRTATIGFFASTMLTTMIMVALAGI